ncbi:MAG: FliM/FliN family flagellar motor switch protein [SAR324 cluster bacterium]
MAQATVNSGQDPSSNDIKLDDLSLDDDALFADLDNEVRLEGTADDSPSQGAADALNLDFDVEAVAKPKGKAPAKSGNGGGAPGSSRASGEDDLGLGLDDSLGGKGDIDLNLDDISGAVGDLNLDLEEPAGTPAAGAGATGGDLLDLDISGASVGDLDLGLDQASAPASATMGETLDLDIPDAVQNGDELKLDLEEPAAAAPDLAAETIELDLEGEATPSEKHPRAGIPSAETEPGMDVEDLSRPRGAEQLEEVMLAEEAPMPAAPGPAAAPEGPAGEFQALPNVDLDVVDLDLEQAASEFQAAPDVDLDAVDLNLDMPLAETHGDAGAPVASPGEMAAASALPETGLSAGMGTGAGGGLAGAPSELLELNLADLESRPEAPGAGGRGNAAPSAWRASAARPPHVPVPAGQGAAVPAVEASPMSTMLLSLPHQVQVRMGTVSMLGQDLVNLGHGSVVPLHRTVGEPVDLIVDGKTIAQGELVVINGRNLGVRIVTLGG